MNGSASAKGKRREVGVSLAAQEAKEVWWVSKPVRLDEYVFLHKVYFTPAGLEHRQDECILLLLHETHQLF